MFSMESETLKQNIEKFILHKSRNWKPKTLGNNRYYFDCLVAFMSDKQFNRDTTEEFFSSMSLKAQSTRHQCEKCILAFVSWMFVEDIIDKDWGTRIERTRIRRVNRVIPDQGTLLKLIDSVTEPTKHDNVLTRFSKMEHRFCLKFILTCSGTRNFETRQIKRGEVSVSERQIIISQGKTGPRTIAIPPIPWLVNEIDRRVKGRTAEETKVLNDRKHYKENYSDLLFAVNEKRLETLMRNAGKLWNGQSLCVHDLRRACLRDLKKNGAGIDDIKNVAGHKNIETTLRYLEGETYSQEATLKNYSSEARKFRTKEEKAKEFEGVARKIGDVLKYHFDGEYLFMKLKVM